MGISSLDSEGNAAVPVCRELRESSKTAPPVIRQSSAKGAVVVLISAVVLLAVLSRTQWPNGVSFVIDGFRSNSGAVRHQRQPSRIPPTPIILSCPTNTTSITCQTTAHNASSQFPNQSTKTEYDQSHSPSCPDYFRYIHEDLKPWNSTGITKEMVESAKKFAYFRLVVIDGKAYFEKYKNAFQTRDVFTVWGILQLLNRYPGRIPDLDLMFEADDLPLIKKSNYQSEAPPPLFKYCTDSSSFDIVFPDWSFWGWAEINIKPWELFLEEIKNASESLKWIDRSPYAFWKGNPSGYKVRNDLMQCNPSNGHDWNARVFAQNWASETANGFKESNLAKQCNYRYKIYVEGNSWSVSEKYILACNSPTLFVTPRFIDFVSRGLMPGKNYWPINPDQMCSSIKFAVDWGNAHQKQSEDLGKEGSRFMQEELSMENVYDYMLHLLTEYGKLLRYKPTVPEKATSVCLESMACPATGLAKKFMLDSMVKSVNEFEPCSLPPPFDKKELDEIASAKEQYLKEVEEMENLGKL